MDSVHGCQGETNIGKPRIYRLAYVNELREREVAHSASAALASLLKFPQSLRRVLCLLLRGHMAPALSQDLVGLLVRHARETCVLAKGVLDI